MQTCRTAGTSADSGIFMPAGLAEHNHRKPAHTQRGNCMYRSETHTALKKNILYFLRWTAISIVMGTVCGLIGTAFGYGVIYAQRLFKIHSFMLYLMPVAGVLIVLLHQMFHEIGKGDEPDSGIHLLRRTDPDGDSALYFCLNHLKPGCGRIRRKRGRCLTDRRMYRKLFRRCVPYG